MPRRGRIPLLFGQFRVLMLLSPVVDRPAPAVIIKNITTFPCNILFGVTVVCMALMGVCACVLVYRPAPKTFRSRY